jgi:hypothetical protein
MRAIDTADLDELDPQWRERFQGDAERAHDYYRPKVRTRVVHHSTAFEPAYEVVDDRDDADEGEWPQ